MDALVLSTFDDRADADDRGIHDNPHKHDQHLAESAGRRAGRPGDQRASGKLIEFRGREVFNLAENRQAQIAGNAGRDPGRQKGDDDRADRAEQRYPSIRSPLLKI